MIILQKIKELRKKKGFSQKDMAEKLNISISGYGKIELGENLLSIDRFLAICKLLEVKSYNQILPPINADFINEIETVLISGGMSFDIIHNNSRYARNLIEKLSENIPSEKLNKDEIIKELEFINRYVQLIDSESLKHGYNFLSIKSLIDNLD